MNAHKGNDFSNVAHTIVLSDVHLADAEPPHPDNPLWKRFKRPRLFVDRTFSQFLDYIQKKAQGPIELVLNGDIFDFDSVMVLPERPEFSISWLEKLRGLASEEAKSRFKIDVILTDHRIWREAICDFVLKGNRLIFVIGNHDMELHWKSVQNDIVEKLGIPKDKRHLVRFCEWFYISNQDTLIEHGNQYDSYCVCSNPVYPLIRKGNKEFVRLPFGNLAGKFMTNGMGLFNPHAESSYIKEGVREYLVFFYRYVMRTQPLLIWTWLWGAVVTLIYSVGEGLLPAVKDPFTRMARIEEIANKANTSPQVVLTLQDLHVHPAIFNPIKILRELWLDRALLLIFIFFASFQFFTFLNFFMEVSAYWFFIPLLLLLPPFIFYARNVESEIKKIERASMERVPLSAKISNVNRVVHGHTHHELHTRIDDVELLNPGTWSPAFHDVECTKPYGRKCFVWIRPGSEKDNSRKAELHEWLDPDSRVLGEVPSPLA